MFIEDGPEVELMHDAQHHHKLCKCAGCFLSWLRNEEAIEFSQNWRRLLAEKRKNQETIAELQRLGIIPPGEPFGQMAA